MMRDCPRCGGAGYDPENVTEERCRGCGGSGRGWVITREMSKDAYGDDRAEGMEEPCQKCGGYGAIPQQAACSKCGGYGQVHREDPA